jgi:class 3 adenylate cyclase
MRAFLDGLALTASQQEAFHSALKKMADDQAAMAAAMTEPIRAALNQSASTVWAKISRDLAAAATLPTFTSSRRSEVPEPRRPEKAIPLDIKLFDRHAPKDWESQLYASDVRAALKDGRPIHVAVVAADIRSSTVLMKEAVSARAFADVLGSFVESARAIVREKGGWFDKFTGDGFLAFWPYKNGTLEDTLPNLLEAVKGVFAAFYTDAIPAFRSNSQNFPEEVGLAIGMAAGPASLGDILGPALVGAAVVGAARMVKLAPSKRTFANAYLGEILSAASQDDALGISVDWEWLKVEEQSSRAAVYSISFNDFELPE